MAMVLHLLRELHALGTQCSHAGVDVVAVERDLGAARGHVHACGGVHAQVGLGSVEDEPAVAHVGAGQADLVAHEGAQGFGLG